MDGKVNGDRDSDGNDDNEGDSVKDSDNEWNRISQDISLSFMILGQSFDLLVSYLGQQLNPSVK